MWVHVTTYGTTNMNVLSAVIFHPHERSVVISASLDKCIRVWEMAKGYCKVLYIFHRQERFWGLSAHPTMGLFAAGHDRGLVVFKVLNIVLLHKWRTCS